MEYARSVLANRQGVLSENAGDIDVEGLAALIFNCWTRTPRADPQDSHRPMGEARCERKSQHMRDAYFQAGGPDFQEPEHTHDTCKSAILSDVKS